MPTITGAETILAAAQAAGIAIPYACQIGLCGICQVKELGGEVEINRQGGIIDDAIADGCIVIRRGVSAPIDTLTL